MSALMLFFVCLFINYTAQESVYSCQIDGCSKENFQFNSQHIILNVNNYCFMIPFCCNIKLGLSITGKQLP